MAKIEPFEATIRVQLSASLGGEFHEFFTADMEADLPMTATDDGQSFELCFRGDDLRTSIALIFEAMAEASRTYTTDQENHDD